MASVSWIQQSGLSILGYSNVASLSFIWQCRVRSLDTEVRPSVLDKAVSPRLTVYIQEPGYRQFINAAAFSLLEWFYTVWFCWYFGSDRPHIAIRRGQTKTVWFGVKVYKYGTTRVKPKQL